MKWTNQLNKMYTKTAIKTSKKMNNDEMNNDEMNKEQ